MEAVTEEVVARYPNALGHPFNNNSKKKMALIPQKANRGPNKVPVATQTAAQSAAGLRASAHLCYVLPSPYPFRLTDPRHPH
jgi:hypothetical protein